MAAALPLAPPRHMSPFTEVRLAGGLLRESNRALYRVRLEQKAREARGSLIAYAELMHPDPNDVPELRPVVGTTYDAQAHHWLLAEMIERLERRELRRGETDMPPRHGKSEMSSRLGPSWYIGKHPTHDAAVVCCATDLAEEFGDDVRGHFESPRYQMVFPGVKLRKGSKARKRLRVVQGGRVHFLGRGSMFTGKGAHFIVVDDPLKDRTEADSKTIRDKAWKHFTQVVRTRLMDDEGIVLIAQTRWHEDDIPGRLFDKRNPYYKRKEAVQWTHINLPAFAKEDDPLGRKLGEPLWPGRFSKKFLEDQKRLDPRGFNSLYQGSPSADDGDYFEAAWFRTYKPGEAPATNNLRIYASSDHALGLRQTNDRTALLIWGVDSQDNIWLLDLFWGRVNSEDGVARMIGLMKKWQPIMWFTEDSVITKTIGPFLRKAMAEENVYCAIKTFVNVADKEANAQSFKGRMSMGKVIFPGGHPQYEDFRAEMLAFSHGTFDDFVDACAYLGRALTILTAADGAPSGPKPPEEGTLGALMAESRNRERERREAGDQWTVVGGAVSDGW